MALSPEDAAYIVDQFGIDVERPLLTQVSRFDPWKDPLGVIDAYRLVKEEIPDVQLALVGSMAHDDPGGLGVLQPDRQLRRRRSGHLHPLEPQQRRLGRGERVPGALGRGDPEVDPGGLRADGHARRCGRRGRPSPAASAGSSTQIEDGETGWLVDSSPRSARRPASRSSPIPAAARERALRGKEHVRRNFLTPRLLRDWLVALQPARSDNDTGGAEVIAARSGSPPG